MLAPGAAVTIQPSRTITVPGTIVAQDVTMDLPVAEGKDLQIKDGSILALDDANISGTVKMIRTENYKSPSNSVYTLNGSAKKTQYQLLPGYYVELSGDE